MAKEPQDARASFTAFANSLGGTYSWVTISKYPIKYVQEFTVVADGREVVGAPLTGGKGVLVGATFTASLTAPVTGTAVTLRRERRLDRLGKKIHINREFQSGDVAFDRAIYIESSEPDTTLARLFGDSSVRGAVVGALSGVANEVVLGGVPAGSRAPSVLLEQARRSIRASIDTKHFDRRDDLVACINALATLANVVDESFAREPAGRAARGFDPPIPTRTARGVMSFGFAAAIWIVLFCITSPPTVGWRAFAIGSALGVLLWFFTFVVFAALLRGRSTSLRNVLLLAVLALGLVPLGGRLGEIVNASLDHGARTSNVGSARMVYPSRGPAHPVVMLFWLDDTLSVPNAMADRLKLSSALVPVRVVMGAGGLGSPWIEALEPVEAGAKR